MLKLPSDNTFPGNARNPENQIAKLYFENKFVLPSVLPGKCRQKFDMIYICIMCLVPLLVQLQICPLNSHQIKTKSVMAEASRYCHKVRDKKAPWSMTVSLKYGLKKFPHWPKKIGKKLLKFPKGGGPTFRKNSQIIMYFFLEGVPSSDKTNKKIWCLLLCWFINWLIPIIIDWYADW